MAGGPLVPSVARSISGPRPAPCFAGFRFPPGALVSTSALYPLWSVTASESARGRTLKGCEAAFVHIPLVGEGSMTRVRVAGRGATADPSPAISLLPRVPSRRPRPGTPTESRATCEVRPLRFGGGPFRAPPFPPCPCPASVLPLIQGEGFRPHRLTSARPRTNLAIGGPHSTVPTGESARGQTEAVCQRDPDA